MTNAPYTTPNSGNLQNKCCTKCKKVFPATAEFWCRARFGKYGFSAICKACHNVQRNEWNKNNPGYVRKQNTKYYSAHLSEIKVKQSVYRTSHLESLNIAKHNRRARKLGFISDLTKEQWSYALTYFDYKCAYCGEDLKLGQKMAKDHFIPEKMGGGTTASNIVPACHSAKGSLLPGCNTKKSSTTPEIWIIREFGKNKGRKILNKIQIYFENIKQ